MSSRAERPVRRLLSVAVALSLGAAALPAFGSPAAAAAAAAALIQTTPAEPPAASVNPDGIQRMVLEVVLNNTDTHELLDVTRARDGGFSAKAGDLRRLRLKIDPALPGDAMVRLRDLPGLTTLYDEAQQSLTLHAPDALMQSYDVSLDGAPQQTNLAAMQPISSAILNYGLYDNWQGGQSHLSGNLEALVSNRVGIFSTTALYNQNAMSGYSKSVRLDSNWRYIDAQKIRSYTIGDFVSNALSWTNSVRMAGFQIASAFDQRPDIVTAALPQFGGSAALPSTLDLYVNQQRIYSGDVPSGPYQLKSLPYLSGGDVTLVATDATGRQITTTQAYYYNTQQLRQGVFEYSLDVGVPRFNYGTKSSDYDHTVFASGATRYGLTDQTTLEGQAQGSGDGLANFGAGIVQGLGGHGTVSTSWTASHYKGWTGGQGALNVEGLIGNFQWYAGSQRTFGDYFDLARVSNNRSLRHDARSPLPITTDYPLATAQASAIDRVGVSFKTWFDPTQISLSMNRIRLQDHSTRTANLSLSRSLTRQVSLYANAYANMDNHADHGVYFSVNINLDHNINAQFNMTNTNGHAGYTQQVDGMTGQRQGSLGWGVSNTFNADSPNQRGGYLNWRTNYAQLRADVYQYGSSTYGDVSAEGSLVIAGGGVFAADRIGNAYAIVTHAGPGAEVMQGGVLIGQANSHGRLLLPDITPYYEQHVYLDPSTLADGWAPEVTERVAIAGYRQGTILDFGAKRIHDAVVILHGKNGKPIAPGYLAQLYGGESATVGYDGQVYLSELKAHNRLSVDMGSAGTCTVSFDFNVDGPPQQQIGPLTCQ